MLAPSDTVSHEAEHRTRGLASGPDISVLIVSYNTRDLLDACLRSLDRGLRRHSYEVVVADNGSHDGSVAMLRQHWPNVHIVETGTNLGFARGVNRAYAAASGRTVLLLNSDTDVRPGALDCLVDFLDSHPEAGVAAPRLLNSDGTDQGTARAFPSAAAVLFGRKSVLTRLFPHNRWSRRYLVGRDHVGDTPFQVDWVSGACLMVPRRVIDQVGPLDEGFFMYWEDADWCRRIGAAGYATYCVPSAIVTHHEGQSSHGRPAHLVWAFHMSVYRYVTKHHAPYWWHPLRPLALAGLSARASLMILANTVERSRGRPSTGGLASRT